MANKELHEHLRLRFKEESEQFASIQKQRRENIARMQEETDSAQYQMLGVHAVYYLIYVITSFVKLPLPRKPMTIGHMGEYVRRLYERSKAYKS